MKYLIKTKAITACFAVLFALMFVLSMSSCEEGRPGRDGRAYVSLTWSGDMPEYVDAGTSSVPPQFQWGRFYRAYPGYFNIFYEGQIFNGYSTSRYAWEMDYELYEIKGEPASYCCDGEDGADTYFTIECSPYGPRYYDEIAYKSAGRNEGYELIRQSDDELILKQEKGKYGIKITIRSVD